MPLTLIHVAELTEIWTAERSLDVACALQHALRDLLQLFLGGHKTGDFLREFSECRKTIFLFFYYLAVVPCNRGKIVAGNI